MPTAVSAGMPVIEITSGGKKFGETDFNIVMDVEVSNDIHLPDIATLRLSLESSGGKIPVEFERRQRGNANQARWRRFANERGEDLGRW